MAVDLTSSLDLHDGIAYDINDDGVVVGQAVVNTPFVWRDGVAWLLNDLLIDPSRTTIRIAYSINNDGLIAARGVRDGGSSFGVVLRPVLPLVGDLTCDGAVSFNDLLALLAAWGACTCVADLNDDGVVDQSDLSLLLENWGSPQ
jgi:hypothetical protein